MILASLIEYLQNPILGYSPDPASTYQLIITILYMCNTFSSLNRLSIFAVRSHWDLSLDMGLGARTRSGADPEGDISCLVNLTPWQKSWLFLGKTGLPLQAQKFLGSSSCRASILGDVSVPRVRTPGLRYLYNRLPWLKH